MGVNECGEQPYVFVTMAATKQVPLTQKGKRDVAAIQQQ